MKKPIILLVDDAEDDVFILRFALKKADINCEIRVVTDGQSAIDYLAGTGQYADRARFPFPLVTIVDFHLPRRSGLEVLSWARQQPAFRDHPIVMLSGSSRTSDEDRARQLLATRFFEKSAHPVDVTEYLKSVLEQHAPV